MKYKVLSALVVLTTAVSVAVMLLSSKLQNDVESYEEVKIVQKENEKKQVDEEKDQISDNSKTNDENKEDEDTKIEQEEESVPQENSFVVIDNRKNKGQSQTKQEEEEYPDSTAVFKVESYTIEDRLTLAEKARLLTVAAKISPVDYARISNYLYDDNASRGIINTFSLLKERLSSKDYEKVKDIAEKYMYVDTIEAYINK